MLLATDKQTLEDLNIFGRSGSDSIYHIFNRCATKGGAVILEEWFRYPLADADAINKRSGIIQSFAVLCVSFPFNSTDLDAAETYLANTDERSKLTLQENAVARKLTSMIALDIETKQIYKGVEALVYLMSKAQVFVAEPGVNTWYAEEKEELQRILNDPAFSEIRHYAGKLSHAQIAAFDGVLRFQQRTLVEKLLRAIYQLDVYLSVAKVANERQFTFPVALPAGQQQLLSLEGVYHPQVKGAVPNNVHVTTESNVLFLTGANMAGKSTFMKSLGIALFLAHAGFPVPAQRMTFAVLDGAYTTINLPDNLGMGASHFYAEVLRVKKLAHELQLNRQLFVVFDELFRGTNVKDAYEATIAITAAFAQKRNSIFVISTHIIEAGAVLKAQHHNIQFVYLPTRMKGNQPEYTYTLEQGITSDRHGMVIINNEQILEILRNGKKKTQKATTHVF